MENKGFLSVYLSTFSYCSAVSFQFTEAKDSKEEEEGKEELFFFKVLMNIHDY